MPERDIQEVIDVILLTMQTMESVRSESEVLGELMYLRDGAFRRRQQKTQTREARMRYLKLRQEMAELESDFPELKEKKIAY